MIATYALCGFANFGSIGIQIGGIGALAPERRERPRPPRDPRSHGRDARELHDGLHRGVAAVSLERADEAAAYVKSRTPLRPSIALVLGSGLGAFADSMQGATVIPYGEIPHFPTSTAIGHSGRLVVGATQGVPVAVMAGRVHYYEGYASSRWSSRCACWAGWASRSSS